MVIVTRTKTVVGIVAAHGRKRRADATSLLLIAAALFLLFVTATCGLALIVTVMCHLSWVGSSPQKAQPPSGAAHIYTTDPSGFPTVQPPACTPLDTCQPISAAPPCCSRGHGASSVCSTALPLGSRASGSKAASEASAAPLRRLRYNRYADAAQAEARDQSLPSGCLMREALIGWDVVATHMCPLQMVNPSCSRNDCDDQVGCITAI
jgi:hypothetical protein